MRHIPSQRVASFGSSIFGEMSILAQRHQAINLGQGFPDFPGPELIKAAASAAIAANLNQYPPSPGVPRLRQALASQWAREYQRPVDWEAEVTITSGATEGLYGLTQALLDPGDGVVVIEPAYDAYAADITMAGGVPIPVRLRPPQPGEGRWTLRRPKRRLRLAFSGLPQARRQAMA
jgi:aspartate/methionine/tyrosine aminotransferase